MSKKHALHAVYGLDSCCPHYPSSSPGGSAESRSYGGRDAPRVGRADGEGTRGGSSRRLPVCAADASEVRARVMKSPAVF